MKKEDWHTLSEQSWKNNGRWWGASMRDGDEFHRILIHPSMNALLKVTGSERVIDLACGNGVFTKLLAKQCRAVVGADFFEELLESAREAGTASNLTYERIDLTKRKELSKLSGPFDIATCVMGLHDMSDIDVLAEWLHLNISGGGSFIFAVPHPCFNYPGVRHVHETHFGERWSTTISVKVSEYVDGKIWLARTKPGQPHPQPIFHRTISQLVHAFTAQGFVVDGMLEPTASQEDVERNPTLWQKFLSIPPILVVRCRKHASADDGIQD